LRKNSTRIAEQTMSDRPIKLLLVDQDPIFRLGLRVALEEFPNLQVVSEAETYTTALQILAQAQQDLTSVNLVILELGSAHSTSSQQLGLQLCQQLKTQYPNLSVLLLSSVQEQGILLAARSAGVDGYCPKGTPVSELVTAIQEIVAGHSYWFGEVEGEREKISDSQFSTPHPKSKIRLGKFATEGNPPCNFPQNLKYGLLNNLRLSGIDYINTTLTQVTAKLQVPGLPLLERAILAGKQRELLAAHWLLNRVLGSPHQSQPSVVTRNFKSTQMLPAADSSLNSAIPQSDPDPKTQNSPSLLSPKALQAELFASCINKLQFNLQNITNVPLEIDILRLDKKRDLLYIILQNFVKILEEIYVSQVGVNQLHEIKKSILINIWQTATTGFFGKFSRVQLGDVQLEIVTLLLQDVEVVQTEILNKIPLINELLSYLLFQTDLRVDNILYLAGSVEAKEQGLMLLENLLIQLGNGVVQPLLNKLADVEEIKQSFYNRQMLSTREIERFRNNLSWKYRIRNYIKEPKAIFESRYELFVFAPRGIATVSIYAPRSHELVQLTGIPLVVTLMLEIHDAIAPRLESLLSFLGSGVVFVLTQVVGRALGLIARGILQGIGSVSLLEKKNKR